MRFSPGASLRDWKASFRAARAHSAENHMKLIDRTILITGGSDGIGLAFAVEFAKRGNHVIVTGRRQPLLDEVKRRHPDIHTVRSDVSDPAQVAALAQHMRSYFPRLDVVINNAGISRYRNLALTVPDPTELMSEVEINLGGVIRMTSAFIDVLVANRGTLINISSALAFVPLPCLPIYCATKAAIHSYTQSLRFQLHDAGVEVVEIMPPAVRTEMTAELPDGDGMTLITPDRLVTLSIGALAKGKLEIHPGQTAQLALMRRLAPGFINRQLWKVAKGLIPHRED